MSEGSSKLQPAAPNPLRTLVGFRLQLHEHRGERGDGAVSTERSWQTGNTNGRSAGGFPRLWASRHLVKIRLYEPKTELDEVFSALIRFRCFPRTKLA